ncbi:flagellar hook-length control protein FliK [Guptibacillus algicola]|uniref:flagellar hook-length control protein FliK n=1 Tax=Guptibacillus algicola TaxID=225844 RepID=UPI001CD67116|nr:flagellar hook-length control protein FliK [Alkalihalobacillus algicola]MCA0988912.1 flagellar hook-length control protein FliK [Alkalihalobacillus algicola]
MSKTIQPLAKGTQSAPAKAETPKGNSGFEKLLTKLADGEGSKKKDVKELQTEEVTEGATEELPANAASPLQVMVEKLGISAKQLLLTNPKGEGSSDVEVHGFTKDELLKLDPGQQLKLKQSLVDPTVKVSEEGNLKPSEVQLKVLKMAEQIEPLLGKQQQSDLQALLKRNGIDLPPSSMTGKGLVQDLAVSVETATVQTPEENEQVQPKPLAEPLLQTSVKEELPVVRARQLTHDFSQLLERMQVMKNGKESQLRIKLAPENLGQLDIRLTTVEGKVTAYIATTTAAAKEMIEGQLNQLRQTFVQQGIQLDKVEVVQQSSQSLLQDHQSHQQGQQQFGQGKHRREKSSGQYEVEENPVVTHEHEQEETIGINYSV